MFVSIHHTKHHFLSPHPHLRFTSSSFPYMRRGTASTLLPDINSLEKRRYYLYLCFCKIGLNLQDVYDQNIDVLEDVANSFPLHLPSNNQSTKTKKGML